MKSDWVFVHWQSHKQRSLWCKASDPPPPNKSYCYFISPQLTRNHNDQICPTLDLSVLIVASTSWTVSKFGHQWHFNWFKWEQMVMLTAFRAFSELASASLHRRFNPLLYHRYKDFIGLNLLHGTHLKHSECVHCLIGSGFFYDTQKSCLAFLSSSCTLVW